MRRGCIGNRSQFVFGGVGLVHRVVLAASHTGVWSRYLI